MIALDTSVVVAAYGAWHEYHSIARQLLAELLTFDRRALATYTRCGADGRLLR